MLFSPGYSVLLPLAPWEDPFIVEEAIASLELQSLRPNQLVVSCDGSLPTALKAVFADVSFPIDWVEGCGGDGVGRVLARGLLACRHEFVVRADADDVSLPQRCEHLMGMLASNSELVVVGSCIDEFIRAPNEIVSQRHVPLDGVAVACCAHSRNPFNHPSVALRRSAILAVGNYRHMPGFEDYDLWLRVLQKYGSSACSNCGESLVKVRVGSTHLRRRHGLKYATREAFFFTRCALDGLLPWWSVVSNLIIRLPLRLLPSWLLKCTMDCVRR